MVIGRRCVALLALCACTPAAPAPTVNAEAVLTRTSVALRGRLPTVSELDKVARPGGLDRAIDAILADSAFGARVADLVAPVWRTRVDQLSTLGADPLTERALGDQPLRMVAQLADADLPWTELVTGDWTMADGAVAAVWPVDVSPAPGDWKQAHWTDGRPAAGVLSSNTLWWRYRSTVENVNRGRANAVSRILLCEDFSARPVHFERTAGVLDAGALLAETLTNPSCVNCHSTLDPISAYLYGFWYFGDQGERAVYQPATEPMWRSTTGIAPSFFGVPGYTLEDLGQQIAGDPRFVQCAVETVWEGLLRRDKAPADQDRLTVHREAFLDGGLTMRALVGSIVRDPAWQAAASDQGDDLLLMTPRTLQSVMEDLTGFRWTSGGVDLLDDDRLGVRTLAGGADGREITHEARSPTATTALVVERVAEAAATRAVSNIAVRDGLFGRLDGRWRPDTDHAEMAGAVQHLFRRVLGRTVAADGDEVRVTLALWDEALLSEGESWRAWAVVLAYLLRDPEFLTY